MPGALDIPVDEDFARIVALPRRRWTPEQLRDLSRRLTLKYKTRDGTQKLFLPQAQVLAEAKKMGGVYTTAPVGSGKTIMTALLPKVLGAKNPALFVPASSKAKTFKDFAEIRKHWEIPTIYPVFSYELLQHANQRRLLLDRKFDLIVCDEVDRLKFDAEIMGPRSNRMLEFLAANPGTKFAALTGTPMKTSLMNFWHAVLFALRDGAPLPKWQEHAEAWAEATDVEQKRTFGGGDDNFVVRSPRNLLRLGGDDAKGSDKDRAIRCIQRRLTESWGFVNVVGMSCDKAINLKEIDDTPVPLIISEALALVDQTGEDLNGDVIETALEKTEYRRQLAQGFFYLWDPAPPRDWLRARRTWKRFVREQLIGGSFADSPSLVEAEYPDHPDLLRWRAIEPAFDPKTNRKVAWVDDYLIKAATAQVKAPTIVWVEHKEFAAELARVTGWPLFGGGSRASSTILREDGSRTIIASVKAHHHSKNLQCFHRNLVISPDSNAAQWEQLIGRTHRTGQTHDVDLGLFTHVGDFADALARAMRRAKQPQGLFEQPQKLLWATKV